jgi:hypothetical protein
MLFVVNSGLCILCSYKYQVLDPKKEDNNAKKLPRNV